MSGDPHAIVTAARERASSESSVVVVGHSGAGFFVPSIAAGLEVRRLVFVDAGLPACSGEASAGGDFVDSLRALAGDGVLPKWSTWWGDGVMEALVPHEAHRADVEAELPEIPLSLYESPIAVPPGWCSAPCGYLLLSEPYRQDATRATSLGWPVIERLGAHLDIVNDPHPMAHAIVDLADVPKPGIIGPW
jgi:hypothetical protein